LTIAGEGTIRVSILAAGPGVGGAISDERGVRTEVGVGEDGRVCIGVGADNEVVKGVEPRYGNEGVVVLGVGSSPTDSKVAGCIDQVSKI
jgi:hypothetical protein